jgi:hypothetical protein
MGIGSGSHQWPERDALRWLTHRAPAQSALAKAKSFVAPSCPLIA